MTISIMLALRNSRLLPSFIPAVLGKDVCLYNRFYLTAIWIFHSVLFIISNYFHISCWNNKYKLFFTRALHRFPEKNSILFFHTSLVQILFPYLRGWQDVGNDAIKAGRGDYRVWLEMQVQAYPPTQATVSSPQEVLFTARLAQVSEKDYSNSLRKSYMQSADFSVKPQQLNRLQRNARETASNARPPGASYGYRCYKNTARVMGKHCKCDLKNHRRFLAKRGSLEHIDLPC